VSRPVRYPMLLSVGAVALLFGTLSSQAEVKPAVDGGDQAAPAKEPAKEKDAAPKYEITIDTSETPDLTDWAQKELRPVCEAWYPKIVEMLPIDGFEAPKKFSITFHKDKQGVADTGGTRINCAADWFRKNLKGEAKGAVVHEMVHVVQQYGYAGGGRRGGRRSAGGPVWLVEGVADYIRWYKYEPQSHGTNIRTPNRVHYNDSYRVTANFLNWATENCDKDLVRKLNAAMRQGKYNEDLWKQYTGKTTDELDKEWKESLSKKG
jgi:hypothetical protein